MIWQPIDTAPRDETDILLYFPEVARMPIRVGHYVDCQITRRGKVEDASYWFIGEMASHWENIEPSHWASLPNPPE